MANAMDLSLAFDSDNCVTATTARLPQHSHLLQIGCCISVYWTIADLACPRGVTGVGFATSEPRLDKEIAPHIPVWERYERTDGMFSRVDFSYDAERDLYICPNARPLRTSGTVHDGRIRNYLPHLGDCRVCKLKERCTRAPFRKLTRDINEEARDHARSLKGTPEFERSSDQRKKIEMRFAHLKTHHRFERLRLRGLSGARDEFHLAAVVQNLKTLATCLWRSPPNLSAACLT